MAHILKLGFKSKKSGIYKTFNKCSRLVLKNYAYLANGQGVLELFEV